MRKILAKGLLAFMAAPTLVGCQHSVQLNSNPPGADVYVEGQYAGKTPCAFREKGGFFGKKYTVRAEKAGYKSVQQVVDQDFNTEQGGVLFVSGLFLLVPCCFLPWAYSAPDLVSFQLEPVDSGEASKASTGN